MVLKNVKNGPPSLFQKYSKRIAFLLAVIGGAYFIQQGFYYAHQQASVLDEGAYLVKGYLFALGRFKPFQYYGPWTNHMPLSYLIPGYIQLWLGTGIRIARYSTVLITFMGLTALWHIAKRLAGDWWAAWIVWAVALNPLIIKLYSASTSQGLVFSLLCISLALTLGKDRRIFETVLGAIFAAMLLLTRINMAPVYFLVILYIYWQHGKRHLLWAFGTSLLLLITAHIYYAPGIFEFWAHWVPGFITDNVVKILNIPPPLFPSEIAAKVWDKTSEADSITRFRSFWIAIKSHFISSLSFAFSIIMFKPRNFWNNNSKNKIISFLFIMQLILYSIHIWAALGNSYCVFCLESYFGFFSPISLLLLVLVLSPIEIANSNSIVRQAIIFLSVLGIAFWIGYNDSWIIVRDLLNLELPRMSGFQRLPGSISLWGFLENLFGWGHQVSFRIVSIIMGILLIVFLISFTVLIYKFMSKKKVSIYSIGVIFLVVSLSFGLFSSKSNMLGGYNRIYDCRGDVIDSYEKVGESLQAVIPAGSVIYWQGGLSAVPLLYLSDINIFPAQLNNEYSRFIGGDGNALRRIGRWNDELSEQWLQEADYILVAEENMQDLENFLYNESYTLILSTPEVLDCRENAPIHVFYSDGH